MYGAIAAAGVAVVALAVHLFGKRKKLNLAQMDFSKTDKISKEQVRQYVLHTHTHTHIHTHIHTCMRCILCVLCMCVFMCVLGLC